MPTVTCIQKHYILERDDNWIECPPDCSEILEIWDRDNHTLLKYAENPTDIPPLCGKTQPHMLAKPVCYYITKHEKIPSIHFYPYPESCTLFTVHYIVGLRTNNLKDTNSHIPSGEAIPLKEENRVEN